MKTILATTALLLSAQAVAAAPVYLNKDNITVSLGASMAAEPFENTTTAQALSNVIDAPSASATETHTQSSHVWVSSKSLELDFDFGTEYDLTALHLWNYHTEAYDVDTIDFKFYDAANSLVGSLLSTPSLGVGVVQSAQTYLLSFPARVQYVNAVLSGDNGQVDFNNIGFTGEVSPPIPEVPLPASLPLLAGALGLFAAMRGRRRGL
ncbi:MAG: PEP-CTERM sorting domain-containing protein [Jhaorihella sp.]